MTLLKRPIVLWTALFVLIMTVSVVMTGRAQNLEQQLNAYLTENNAKPEEREAYHFAMQHPEVLKVLPCYCGCKNLGHKSNYNCFFKGGKVKKADQFDEHGLVCPMCVNIALGGKQLHAKGVPLSRIRAAVDKAYGKHEHLHSTDTPLPSQ